MVLLKNKSIKQIINNTGWMLFDKVFILLLNLIVTVRIANYYGASDYGVYEYAVSIVAIFEVLITFVDARVVKKRYYKENPDEVVWNATLSRLLFSFLSLLLGLVFLVFCKEAKQFSLIFIVLLVNAIIINLKFGIQSRYEYLLVSKKVVLASNIALTVGGVFQLIAVSLQLPIIYIALITSFSSLLSFIIIAFQYKKDFGIRKKRTTNCILIKGIIKDSFPLAIAASCAIIYSRCDSIMIGAFLTKEDVGIYAIAVKLISTLQICIVPIRESIYPKMIQLFEEDRKKYTLLYIKITAILTWLCIIGALASFIVLPVLFKILKPEYNQAFSVYRIYVISSFFMYNAGLRAGHFTLINRGVYLTYSQIISVFVNILLNYFMISKFGIYGAAIATAITQGISLWLTNIFLGKEGREVLLWQLRGLNPVNIFRK